MIPSPIGGWLERFDERADLWLWHAPDWFWLADRGHWPSGLARSGHTAPLLATLHMLWRRWIHGEEVCWWGYADDVAGRPMVREAPLHPALVCRTRYGLLSHGVQLSGLPVALVRLELRWREWRTRRQLRGLGPW